MMTKFTVMFSGEVATLFYSDQEGVSFRVPEAQREYVSGANTFAEAVRRASNAWYAEIQGGR